MKKNLNIETEGSWCYDNNADNCAKYGRLYNWNAAKTVCPSGWRLPDKTDWNRLVETAGGWEDAGKKLKSSTSDWIDNGSVGTDDYRFAALPGGYCTSSGKFYRLGEESVWWTATKRDNNSAYYQTISYDFDDMQEDTRNVSYGYSVRCVKKD